jgi:geranylgeranyl reductase family protein
MEGQKDKRIFDVVIVGAGPAGSSLGALLSGEGLNVLVIDKERFPRQKLCGGCLTWKTRKWLEGLMGISLSTRFSVESICGDYIIYEKFKKRVFQRSPEILYFVDRKKYDWEWIQIARKKGCRFLFGDRVANFDVQNNAVLTKSGRSYKGEIVAGADGAASIIRRKVRSQQNFKRHLTLAFQLCIPRSKVESEYRNSSPKLFIGAIRRGYGWIFPQGRNFLVGLWGLIREGKYLEDAYLNMLDHVTTLNPEEKATFSSCTAPSGYFMERPGENKVLLVGDAAGFVDPLTGEGIYYAHKSAECAWKAIREYFGSSEKKDLVESYKRHLLPVFTELIISRRLSRLAYSPLRYFAYFLNSPGFYSRLAEIIHGKRKYSSIPLFSRWNRMFSKT